MVKDYKVFLSICLPVYNNQDTILPLCDQLIMECNKLSINFELIIGDDNSVDLSVEKLFILQSRYDNVLVLRNSHNYGQHANLMNLLQFTSGKFVLFMDADYQDDPLLVKSLLNKIVIADCDAIIVKWLNYTNGRLRGALSMVFYCLNGILFFRFSFIRLGTLRVFNENVRQYLLMNYKKGALWRDLFCSKTFKVLYFPAKRLKRMGDSNSSYSLIKLIKLAMNNFIYRFCLILVKCKL